MLETFRCSSNDLATVDVSKNPFLVKIFATDNPLEFLNIHNGRVLFWLEADTTELLYICLDEMELDYIASVTDPDHTILLTDCNFDFGDVTYDLRGQALYSTDPDCDSDSETISNLTFNIDNGSTSVAKPIYDSDGVYLMPLPEDDYAISIRTENPELFNYQPDTLKLTIDSLNAPYYQDFCIWPKGASVADTKVSIIPIDLARPGFEVDYKVIFSNHGNVTSSGSLIIDYPETVSQYVSSSMPMNDDLGSLTLNYEDLRPFEKKRIANHNEAQLSNGQSTAHGR